MKGDTFTVDNNKIHNLINMATCSTKVVAQTIISKARNGNRLSLQDIAILICFAKDVENSLFDAAAHIRKTIYRNRIVLFAPLYISNTCVNDCVYCGFRISNAEVSRKTLSDSGALDEVKWLHNHGYRRILLESTEDKDNISIERVCSLMKKIYSLKDSGGRPMIDRINVNVAATTKEDYQKLNAAGIGTYNLFQETYHCDTYQSVHPKGPKHSFGRQINAPQLALEANIGDLGMGVLYGLYEWKFELLAMIMHINYLESNFGIGSHTISFPRIKPASGINFKPPYPVDDETYLRIIAITRLALPYSGLVISTREPKEIRRKSYKIGISQTSAGSSTEVGGYNARDNKNSGQVTGQFTVADDRPLEEVIHELLTDGFIPSFCTACEYRGRTGEVFMNFAKTGLIGTLCMANSVLSLAEYLRDASQNGFLNGETITLGKETIETEILKTSKSNQFAANEIRQAVQKILGGETAREHFI